MLAAWYSVAVSRTWQVHAGRQGCREIELLVSALLCDSSCWTWNSDGVAANAWSGGLGNDFHQRVGHMTHGEALALGELVDFCASPRSQIIVYLIDTVARVVMRTSRIPPRKLLHHLPLKIFTMRHHRRQFASSVPSSLKAWPKIRRSSSHQPSPLRSLTDAVIPAAETFMGADEATL